MQKKLIALAVAGIMAAPMAAQAASAEIYGKVRLSVDMADNGDTTAGNEDSTLSVSSHSSRFGVKGSEDLDGDLKALYQIEAQVNMDDGDDFSEKLRDSYVGLSGSFGTVLAGKLSTPYKNAGKKADIFVDTAGDYNNIIEHDTRASNAIAYVAPKMGGVTIAAAYVPSATDDDLPQTTADSEMDAVSVSAEYKADALSVALAFESIGDDDDSIKLAGTYGMGDTTLGFVYQNNDDGTNDYDVIYGSLSHKMGDTTLKLAVGSKGETDSNEDDSTMFVVGASKSYSKAVELYALYGSVSNGDNAHTGLKSVKGAVDGETVSVLSAGVNLKFSSM